MRAWASPRVLFIAALLCAVASPLLCVVRTVQWSVLSEGLAPSAVDAVLTMAMPDYYYLVLPLPAGLMLIALWADDFSPHSVLRARSRRALAVREALRSLAVVLALLAADIVICVIAMRIAGYPLFNWRDPGSYGAWKLGAPAQCPPAAVLACSLAVLAAPLPLMALGLLFVKWAFKPDAAQIAYVGLLGIVCMGLGRALPSLGYASFAAASPHLGSCLLLAAVEGLAALALGFVFARSRIVAGRDFHETRS